MKYLVPILSIATSGVLSMIWVIPVYGNEVDIPNSSLTIQTQEAGFLSTKPATISSEWDNLSNVNGGELHTLTSGQTPKSISLIRDQECGKIDPLEIVQNPGSFFRECHSLENEKPIPATERIRYFDIPKLESGIRVNLGKF
jgi:hypothetical protein